MYVALLRGVNVGGKSRVEMYRLKSLFESLGFSEVVTYINSGNIIFSSDKADTRLLCQTIESAIAKQFGFRVPVIVKEEKAFKAVADALPKDWANNDITKCDVLFLWDEIDNLSVINQLPVKKDIDEVVYVPGAVLWRINRANVNKSGLLKLVGSVLYKQVTIRNSSTVRKLAELMSNN